MRVRHVKGCRVRQPHQGGNQKERTKVWVFKCVAATVHEESCAILDAQHIVDAPAYRNSGEEYIMDACGEGGVLWKCFVRVRGGTQNEPLTRACFKLIAHRTRDGRLTDGIGHVK